VVVCEGYRDEGVAPTGGKGLHIVGAHPCGRWVVVCEGYRDGGVAPTGDNASHFCGSPALGAMGGLPSHPCHQDIHGTMDSIRLVSHAADAAQT